MLRLSLGGSYTVTH